MNREQKLSLIRDALKLLGMALAGNGIVNVGTWDIWTTVANEIVGCAFVVGPTIWSQIRHTRAGAVAVVVEIAKEPASPVKGVVTEPTVAGRELAASIPGSQIAAAGTHEAAKIATK